MYTSCFYASKRSYNITSQKPWGKTLGESNPTVVHAVHILYKNS